MASTKLASFFCLAAMSLAQDCYWPAGSPASPLIACGTTAADSTNSACCYKGHYCLSNGLCFEPASMTMYRGGCTDKRFKSPSCSSYCYGTSPNLGISGMIHEPKTSPRHLHHSRVRPSRSCSSLSHPHSLVLFETMIAKFKPLNGRGRLTLGRLDVWKF